MTSVDENVDVANKKVQNTWVGYRGLCNIDHHVLPSSSSSAAAAKEQLN